MIKMINESKDNIEYVYTRKDDKIVKIPKYPTCQDEVGTKMYMCESEYGGYTYCFSESEVTENIEELLDEYVVDCRHGFKRNPYIYTSPLNVKDYYLGLLQEFKEAITIYGAIWTNRGLMYVARINADGEWEII